MLNKFKSMIMAITIAFFSVGLVAQPFADTLNSGGIVEIAQGVDSSKNCHDEQKSCGCTDGEHHNHDYQHEPHSKSHGCDHCDEGCDCDNCKCENCNCPHCTEKAKSSGCSHCETGCDCESCKCSHCTDKNASAENDSCGCQNKECDDEGVHKCGLKHGDSAKSCQH